MIVSQNTSVHAVRSGSRGKFHLVSDRGDHTALCGREHSSSGSFNSQLGDEHLEWARGEGMVCGSCERKGRVAA